MICICLVLKSATQHEDCFVRESNERALDSEKCQAQYEDGVVVQLREHKKNAYVIEKNKPHKDKSVHSVGKCSTA